MERQVRLLGWVVVLTIIGAGFASQSQDTGNNQRTLDIKEALKRAKEINYLRRVVDKVERDLEGQASQKAFRCPLSIHHGKRASIDSEAGRKAADALLTMRILMNEYGYSPDELQTESAIQSLREMEEFTCDPPDFAPCNFSSKYRPIDGSCNNEHNPEWGMAGTMFGRLVASDFADETGTPRTEHRPNARDVSNTVHSNHGNENIESKVFTAYVFQWGQFLDHDVGMTSEIDFEGDCCEDVNAKDTDKCFNIIIKHDDKDSDVFVEGYCMEVKRSAGALCPDATSEGKLRRQQFNGITGFIDGSNLYGSDHARHEKLRDQGDKRVDETVLLSTMHNLWVLEHNRIANIFKDWYTPDIAFEETRKLVIAIMQQITYNEFLPALFSKNGLKLYGIRNTNQYEYNAKLDPTIVNVFAGAAYRFGHALIPPTIDLYDRDLESPPDISENLDDNFFNPNLTYLNKGYARLAYGLSARSSNRRDSILIDAVRNRLFKVLDGDGNIVEARDLAALNVQRGRDHGLPPYYVYREFCNGSSVSTHWDLSVGADSGLTDHTRDMRKLLKIAFKRSPMDIDVFTGLVSEKNVKGGKVGPTLECLLGEQFRRLKYGDRHWFQNDKDGGLEGAYSRAQINAVRRYTLSGVLCNNYGFETIHKNAFLLKKLIPCKDIKDLDLNAFAPERSRKVCIKTHGHCTKDRLGEQVPLKSSRCHVYCECLVDDIAYYWSRQVCHGGQSFNPNTKKCVEEYSCVF